MSDLWESTEKLGAYMAQPEFVAALGQVAMPEPSVQVFEVDRQRD